MLNYSNKITNIAMVDDLPNLPTTWQLLDIKLLAI
jgi:hypothetical protein